MEPLYWEPLKFHLHKLFLVTKRIFKVTKSMKMLSVEIRWEY
jgi:hypothetical protein